MKIKKNGWVAKIAYGFTSGRNIPENTNLCKLFWRTLFMLFIGWPFILALLVVAVAAVYFIGFFVASRPTLGMDSDFAPIKKWPKIMGHRIWPTSIISLCILVFVIWHLLPLAIAAVIGWLSANMSIAAMIFVGAFLVIALGYAIKRFFRSELWKLARAYMSAKKQRFCPIVEFVD